MCVENLPVLLAEWDLDICRSICLGEKAELPEFLYFVYPFSDFSKFLQPIVFLDFI